MLVLIAAYLLVLARAAVSPSQVEGYAADFMGSLERLTDGAACFAELQTSLSSLPVEQRPSSSARTVAAALSEAMRVAFASVQNVSRTLREALANVGEADVAVDSGRECCAAGNQSCFAIADGLTAEANADAQRFVRASAQLDPLMQDLHQTYPRVLSSLVARAGAVRRFPPPPKASCKSARTDVRFEPWWQGAMNEPRNFFILIDRSSRNLPLSKSVALRLLSTLSRNDWAIVGATDEPFASNGYNCYQSDLAVRNEYNEEKWKAIVDGVAPRGSSDSVLYAPALGSIATVLDRAPPERQAAKSLVVVIGSGQAIDGPFDSVIGPLMASGNTRVFAVAVTVDQDSSQVRVMDSLAIAGQTNAALLISRGGVSLNSQLLPLVDHAAFRRSGHNSSQCYQSDPYFDADGFEITLPAETIDQTIFIEI